MNELQSTYLSTDLAVNSNANLSRLKKRRRFFERDNANEERHQRVEGRKEKKDRKEIYYML